MALHRLGRYTVERTLIFAISNGIVLLRSTLQLPYDTERPLNRKKSHYDLKLLI